MGLDYLITDPESGKQVNRHEKIENLVYLIEVDGVKLLHLGDAVLSQNTELFDGVRFAEEEIDILFLEYFDWSEETKTIVERWVRPDHIVAMHLPAQSQEIEAIADRLDQTYPNVVVFAEPLDAKVF